MIYCQRHINLKSTLSLIYFRGAMPCGARS